MGEVKALNRLTGVGHLEAAAEVVGLNLVLLRP